MRPTGLITSVCLFAAASSAWPSAWGAFEAAKREIAPLVVRADSTTTYDLSYSATQGNTATTESSATATESDASATGSDASSTGTGKDASSTGTNSDSSVTGTGKTTGKTTGTGTSKGTKTDTSTGSTSYDARLPAGGVTMITPNALAASQYYKIGSTAGKNYVTFAWNYTSLSVTPSAVDILASCSLNSATYTIAMNQSITASTQAITWDTGAYQETATLPLLTETYTLIIHDAAKDVSATASAGYLSTYDQYTFGMYVPQAYTPLADWTCATCSGALSSMERQTMGFMFGMATVTVLSFGWFAGVAGLW